MPGYPERFSAAEEIAAQTLEDEAVRRAFEGIDEPQIWQGRITYKQEPVFDAAGDVVLDSRGRPVTRDTDIPETVKQYSDRLLELLLKRFRPDKYRDRVSAEHSGPGGGPIDATLTVRFVKPAEV